MAEELRYQVILDSSTATAGLRSLAGEQKRFTDSVEESSKVMGGFLGKLNAQAQAMSQARAATQGLRDMGRSLLLAGAGGTALTASFITAAASAEKMKVGLKAVAGSSAEAERQFQSLLKLAESPAFTLESALTGSTRLQQAGFSAQQAEQALKGLGAAMVAAGKGPEELNRASLALSQIALKGRVSAEELMQLAEAGVPAMAILREQFQLTGKDFNDLAGTFERKGISANQVILTLTDTLQTKFGAATKGAGDTATNAFSNFSDALSRAQAALGENLLGPVKSALGVFTEFLKNVENWSPAMKDAAGTAVLAGSALSTVGGTALTVAAQVAQIRLYYHMTRGAAGVGILSKAFGGLKSGMAFLLTNPYAAAIIAIGAAATYASTKISGPLASSVKDLNKFIEAGVEKGYFAEGTQGVPERSWIWRVTHPRAYAQLVEETMARPVRLGPGPARTMPPPGGPGAASGLDQFNIGLIQVRANIQEAEVEMARLLDRAKDAYDKGVRPSAKGIEEWATAYREVRGQEEAILLRLAQGLQAQGKHIDTAEKIAEARKSHLETENQIYEAMRKISQSKIQFDERAANQQRKVQAEQKRHWEEQQRLYRQAWEEANRIYRSQLDSENTVRATTYDLAKQREDLQGMYAAASQISQALTQEEARLRATNQVVEANQTLSENYRLQGKYLEDVARIQERWQDVARRQAEEQQRAVRERYEWEQRIAEATERQVRATEDLIEKQAEQRMGLRERAARWYLDVAQQAQRMGNIPAAQAFAARGRALGQEAAGMGLQMAGFNIGIGGPERAGRGIEQALQAFQAGNFNLAGVQGVGQLIEAGLAAGERPAAMGTFQAFGGQPFQSWLPAQQVVNIYFGERALSMQADPAQVGNIIQAWMNQELLRQRATMPSG